ncbi:MAG: glycosyltransferase family 2 protein [Candidatus Glassbacteria bacterium]
MNEGLQPLLLETIFWILVAFVLYTYFGYPLLVFSLSRFRRSKDRGGEGYVTGVTILVPAFNEESVIERKIQSCLDLDYPEALLRVLVVSDGSTDRTVEIARKYEGERVKVIDYPENRGKNEALNSAMKQVKSEISVISDASVLLERDSLKILIRNFADGGIGGVWGKKIYRNVSQTAGGEGEAAYLSYGNFVKRCESRLGSIVSAEGSLFAYRTELYEELPSGVADDFLLSTVIVRKGFRIEYEDKARSYEETTPTNKGEFRRKSRIIQQAVKGIYLSRDLLNPIRAGFYSIQLLTVKVFRRLVSVALPPIIVLIIALSGTSPFYAILFYAVLLFLLLAFAGSILPPRKSSSRLFSIPFYICLVNLAAIHGFIGFLRGRDVARWKPTERM